MELLLFRVLRLQQEQSQFQRRVSAIVPLAFNIKERQTGKDKLNNAKSKEIKNNKICGDRKSFNGCEDNEGKILWLLELKY